MAQQNTAINASDVRVDFIELLTPSGTFDLLDQLISFNKYESIYDECTRVELVINDSINLPYYAPILGEERLNMTFSTKSIEGGEFEINPGDMYTLSIQDRHITKDRQNVYVLHFVSEKGMINMNTTVSRSWKDKTISSMVRDIYDEYLDIDDVEDLIIEPSKGTESVVIPNWKPFDAINWLAKRALNENDVTNFMYWESNGESYFKTVDTLIKEGNEQRKLQKFVYNPLSNDQSKLKASENGVMEIDSLQIINQFDIAKNIHNGFYASKMITHDIVRKKITQRTHSLDQIYNGSINHTDEWMPISLSETDYTLQDRYTFAPSEKNHSNKGENLQSFYDSKIMLCPKHNKMFSQTSTQEYDNRAEDWLLQRNALINSLNQIKVNITTPGISFLNVGQMVELTVPSPEKVRKTDDGKIVKPEWLKDYYLSGKYIITAINHDVNFLSPNNRYRCNIELTKDALGDAALKSKSLRKGIIV